MTPNAVECVATRYEPTAAATDRRNDLQPIFDAAVVIATIVRPSSRRAVRSVFNQDWPGRIHILIGVDVSRGDTGGSPRRRR